MAQYQLTVDESRGHGLFTQDGALAHLVEEIVQQVLEAQVADHLQAQPYERTEERRGYRNGYKPRSLITRVGTLELRVPQVRDGAFSTDLFARYQRSEQAFILALLEMVINGVSTRKVTHITEELCGTEVSKSTVSALCARLDPLVQAWNERDLSGTAYPFILVDALVLKVREDGRVRARSALIATGINAAGYREIVGLRLGDSESEASWAELFAWLKGRGLHSVDLVTSDSHAGLVRAIQTHFQGASWQRCQAHFARNIIDATPKALHKEMVARLRALFSAADPFPSPPAPCSRPCTPTSLPRPPKPSPSWRRATRTPPPSLPCRPPTACACAPPTPSNASMRKSAAASASFASFPPAPASCASWGPCSWRSRSSGRPAIVTSLWTPTGCANNNKP